MTRFKDMGCLFGRTHLYHLVCLVRLVRSLPLDLLSGRNSQCRTGLLFAVGSLVGYGLPEIDGSFDYSGLLSLLDSLNLNGLLKVYGSLAQIG